MHAFSPSNNSRKSVYSVPAPDTVTPSSRNACDATLLIDADLSVAAHGKAMKKVLTCFGLPMDKAGLNKFIAVSELRDHILDVFASGQRHELVVSGSGGDCRHWRAALTGAEKGKPKQVLLTFEPCTSLIQFESDSGRVTYFDKDECKRLGWLDNIEADGVWDVPALRQLDWQELLIQQLERPGCQVVEASLKSSAFGYCGVRISAVDPRS